MFVAPAATIPWIVLSATVLPATVLPTPARAQATEIVVQNIKLGSGLFAYEAPRVIVRGTRLSQADLMRLLDPASPEPLVDRIMKLEADEILVPELINLIEFPQLRQRTVYRDVSLKKIAGGKIASLSSPGSSVEGTQNGETIRGSMGRFTVADIDAAAAAHVFTGRAGPGEALRRIHGAFSLENTEVDDSKGIKTRMARITSTEFLARPTQTGWMATFEALTAAQANKGNPDALGKTLGGMGEILEAFVVGDTEATGIEMQGRIPTDNMEFDGKIQRMAYAASKNGRGSEIAVEGLDFGSKDWRFKYGRLAFGGLSTKPLIDLIREMAVDPTKPPSAASLRPLISVISSIQFEGLDVDVPAKPASVNMRDANSERIRVGLGQFGINAEKPINGIPTDLKFTIRDLSTPIPPNPSNDGLATIAQLGYDRIDGSFGLSLSWNEANQEIAIRELMLDGKGMGSASIRAMLGNVVRDVFDPDTAVAQVALMGATAKSLDIAIDNRGLFERFIAMQARRQKRSPEDIRREYGTAAAVGIPAILGNSQASKELAQAVAKFVARPGKLTIRAKARQDSGFGIADFAANPTPAGVLEGLDVRATAE